MHYKGASAHFKNFLIEFNLLFAQKLFFYAFCHATIRRLLIKNGEINDKI